MRDKLCLNVYRYDARQEQPNGIDCFNIHPSSYLTDSVSSLGGVPIGGNTAARLNILKFLYFVNLLFDSHFLQPYSLVDTPLLEHLFHVCVSGIFWRLVALRALASFRHYDHLVHIFLALNYVFVGTGNRCDGLVDTVLSLGVVKEKVEGHEAFNSGHILIRTY